MGKINTSTASNNLSNLSFYIDLERSVNYTFPFEISTSVPGPIYARIKNTGAGTITIRARQIIFFMGQPGVGSEYDVATIDPNETKYFQVSSRYLPLTYVSWNTFLNIKIGGKTSIKKQNLGGGKISLFFDTLPLNTQSIKLNLGYEIGGCGNDFILTQNGVWGQNGCDYNVRWDNKDGTLPYRWRFFYSSDGRTDYASHPTAGPDALPKKGWSNGMTISENQLITFGQSLVLNNLPFDADANCNFSVFNRTWIYLDAPSFRYRPIDSLSYFINTPLTPDGYGGNGSYQIRSSDEVYFTNGYSNSNKFPSNNWQLASYIINNCPQITTTPVFSLL
jgi:hypothetical protein